MKVDHYTYRVTWSAEDGEHVGLCAEFHSLTWLDNTPEAALAGIRETVGQVVADMQAQGEEIPTPIADRNYSGEFRVRIPPEQPRLPSRTAGWRTAPTGLRSGRASSRQRLFAASYAA